MILLACVGSAARALVVSQNRGPGYGHITTLITGTSDKVSVLGETPFVYSRTSLLRTCHGLPQADLQIACVLLVLSKEQGNIIPKI